MSVAIELRQDTGSQAALYHAAILQDIQDFVANRLQFTGIMRDVNERDPKLVTNAQKKWNEPLFQAGIETAHRFIQ